MIITWNKNLTATGAEAVWDGKKKREAESTQTETVIL